jgi:hypothetical protein
LGAHVGPPASATGGLNGQVFVLGHQSILDAFQTTNETLKLVLHGKPGVTYRIEYSTSLLAGTTWTFLTHVQLAAQTQGVANPGPSASAIFYRAYRKN